MVEFRGHNTYFPGLSMQEIGIVSPELILAVGGMVLLVIPRLRSPNLLGLVSLALVGAALNLKLVDLLIALRAPSSAVYFSGMLILDRFALFLQLAILVAAALVILSVMGFEREEVRSRREFYVLLLWATVGLLFVAGAQHLALIYVGLELISLLSYLLVGFRKKDSLAVEGALKYFLFGALSTGAFLYGVSLLYGLTGTLDLSRLSAQVPALVQQAPALCLVALLLVAVGLGFKLALVPFHMWAPDAYEGAPAPAASFISLGPKLAGVALLARIFLVSLTPEMHSWPLLLGGLSVLTMTLGNVAALVQTNVKRLLAYSSIAHAGTMVIGLAVATPFGLAALLYYLLAYVLMNAAAFIGVIVVGNTTGREDLGAFSGLAQREPAVAAMITLAFLSLAGIPPLAGFFAKMWIFGAALKAGAVGLAVVAAVNSVIALFYYVRVIKAMYLEPALSSAPARLPSRWPILGLALCTLGLLALGLGQGPWLTLTARALPVPFQPGDLPWL